MMGKLTKCWSSILNNGVREEHDFDQVMRIRISNGISVVGSFFALVYCTYLILNAQYRLALNDVLFILNLMLMFLLNRFGYNKIGSVLTITTVPVMLLYVNHEYGQISTDYFYFACIVLGFYFFKRRLNQILISLFFISLILLTKYLEAITIPNEFGLSVAPYIYISNTLMSLAILFLSISLFISEHEKHKHEMDVKNIQLNAALNLAQQKNEQVNIVLKELNHRVKNNLQMVSSLFNIQSYKTKNAETKKALKDARNRIVLIAIMHQKLYKDNLFYEVKLKKYIEELVDYLVQSVGFDDEINVKVEVDDVKLRIEDTVHVGLLINELLTNALKYGQSDNQLENMIKVEVLSNNGTLTINVCDSGKGFPENFDIEKTDSFGLDLVRNIVIQHNGSIDFTNQNGAKIRLQLKLTEFSD